MSNQGNSELYQKMLIWKQDFITLSCNVANKNDTRQQNRSTLAAIGFGSKTCHLEHWICTVRVAYFIWKQLRYLGVVLNMLYVLLASLRFSLHN